MYNTVLEWQVVCMCVCVCTCPHPISREFPLFHCSSLITDVDMDIGLHQAARKPKNMKSYAARFIEFKF